SSRRLTQLVGSWEIDETIFLQSIARLETILRQDIYKTDKQDTRGRRKKKVVVHKLVAPSPSKNQVQQSQSNQIRSDNARQQSNEDNQCVKYQRRHTTNSEKVILESILSFDSFPEDIAIETLRELQDCSNNWDMQRIRTYWKNNRINKRRKTI
ncbi:28394_t:CDS:2, partial [Racocetra persica]